MTQIGPLGHHLLFFAVEKQNGAKQKQKLRRREREREREEEMRRI